MLEPGREKTAPCIKFQIPGSSSMAHGSWPSWLRGWWWGCDSSTVSTGLWSGIKYDSGHLRCHPWGVLDSGFFLTLPAPPTHLVEAAKLVFADLEMSRWLPGNICWLRLRITTSQGVCQWQRRSQVALGAPSEPSCFIIMYQSCFSDPQCLSVKDGGFFLSCSLVRCFGVCTWYSRSGFCSPTDEDRCTKEVILSFLPWVFWHLMDAISLARGPRSQAPVTACGSDSN